MDTFSGRPNRPVAQRDAAPVQQQVQDARPRVAPAPQKPRSTKNPLLMWIVGGLVALALLAGGMWAYKNTLGGVIDGNKYQAVFLSNGQVYFGKLTRAGEYYKLSNVFYLQANQAAEESNNPQQAASSNSGVQLIKLGNEVHGPEDAMVIEKDQVLFFENLKNDGKVVDSITKYNKEKK